MDDRYFEKYQYGIGSKEHREAMDYIYDRCKCVDPHRSDSGICTCKENREAMNYIYDTVEVRQAEAEDEDLFTQCKKCHEYVNLFEEPIFVMGIYADDKKLREEFWCKKCLKKGVKHAKQV